MKDLAKFALLVTLTLCAWLATRAAVDLMDETRQQVHAMPALLDGRIAAVQGDLNRQLDATRADLNRQLSGIRSDSVGQIAATRTEALTAIAHIEVTADARLASIQADLNAQVAGPVQQATATLADTDRAVKMLTPQALGMLAAAKVTAGQTAQTMRAVEQGTPAIVASVQRAADESAKASANTAKVTANLAEATKPLPKWARVGLAAAPPLAQTAFSMLSLFYLIH